MIWQLWVVQSNVLNSAAYESVATGVVQLIRSLKIIKIYIYIPLWLLCIALYYCVLHYIIVYWLVLLCSGLYYCVLLCITVYYFILLCIVEYYCVLLCIALYYCIFVCITVFGVYCNVLFCISVYCFVFLHITVYFVGYIGRLWLCRWKGYYKSYGSSWVVQSKVLNCIVHESVAAGGSRNDMAAMSFAIERIYLCSLWVCS